MKKLVKWVSIIVGGLLAVLIIGAIALPLFLPLDKIKDLATQKISEIINREVKIEKVSFNIFTGIKLEKISVSNRKGFAKKPFVSADAIVLRYAFWPIFKKQIIVKEISLVKPEILVEKSAAGVFNFSDLTKKEGEKKKKAEAKPKEKKQAFSMVVDSFSIRKARITYVDYKTKAKSEIKNANLKISGITLAMLKPIDLKFSATAAYQGKDIPLSVGGKIGVNLKKEILDLPRLSLSIAGEKAAISAKVSNWKKGPSVDFSISSKKLSVDPFLAVFGGKAPKKKKVKAKRGELTKKINKLTKSISSKYRVSGRINIENLTLKDFEVDKIDLELALKNKQLSVNIKEIAIYEGSLSGKAKVNLAASGLSYSIQNLKLDGFNSTPFVNDMVETFLTRLKDHKDLKDKIYGKLTLKVDLKGRGVEPQDIFANAVGDGSFTLSGGAIKRMKLLSAIGKKIKSNSLQEDLNFKDLHAAFGIKNQVITVKELELSGKGIKVDFKGSADLAGLKWVPGNRLTLKLSPALTAGIPKEFSLFRDKSGWFELVFEITGSLKMPIPKPILDKPIEKVIGKIKVKLEAKKLELEKKASEELKKKEEAAKKAVEEEKRKAEEAARKKAEEEKARLAEEAKRKAAEEAKKLIKF